MTCGLPPDSRSTTHCPNAPPGMTPREPLVVAVPGAGSGACCAGAGCATTGAVLACRGVGVVETVGAGASSCDGAFGISAGSAGVRSTCPAVVSAGQGTG